MTENKIVLLSEAIKTVQNGDIVYLGGVIEGRPPMAAMFEIIRQQKKDLIGLCLIAFEDILVSAGCMAASRGSYTHMGIFGKANGVHRKMKEGKFVPDDIGHIDCETMLLGAAYGLPYIASGYCIGSDITNPKLDHSEKLRAVARNKDKIPSKKYIYAENPFAPDDPKVVLLPTIKPDVAIIHVGQASKSGTCRIDGNPLLDVYGAFAADKVILTAEEIVDEAYLRLDPNRNLLPCTKVDMVVQAPWGAHPGINPGYYDLDMAFVSAYQKAAKEEATFQAWAQEWIHDVKDHSGYLEKLGVNKLESLRAMKPFGYKPRG